MKELNSFKISGYVGYSNVDTFKNASVCRFSLAVSQTDENNKRTSAFINAEAWKQNNMEDFSQFEILSKGKLVTIEGYFKPEEWLDEKRNTHSRLVLVANKFYPTENKISFKKKRADKE